jgi:hypothetical protein
MGVSRRADSRHKTTIWWIRDFHGLLDNSSRKMVKWVQSPAPRALLLGPVPLGGLWLGPVNGLAADNRPQDFCIACLFGSYR